MSFKLRKSAEKKHTATRGCLSRFAPSLKIKYLVLFFALFTIFCNPLYAENADKHVYEKKLDRLHKNIEKIKEHLQSTRYKRSHVITDLQQLESKISNNAKTLKKTESLVSELDNHLSSLNSDLKDLQASLESQRRRLGEQMRAAYAIGSQQQVKLLLNQQNPAEMGRVMVYFDYLSQARQRNISTFLQSIQEKQRLETELAKSQAEQQQNLILRKQQRNQLQRQRLKRNQLLARLDAEIRNQEQTLTELETSRNRIENLLMSLGELLADIPQSPSDKQPFHDQKGRLPWPVQGKLLAKFGSSREKGDLKWNGVLISAAYGEPVQAISHGRVAFADWLQGYGFITIIDHGDGYMSLYGHNESQFKQAGDWVEPGDVIATVGDSGGQPDPGVYFEIRARGKPVNPGLWCSNTAKFASGS
jgi:septal ring factor EnvC (AmiA/AmiB activator)